MAEADATVTYMVVNIKCSFCGRMIPADPVKKETEKGERLFCSEECYRLYLDYKPEQEAKTESRPHMFIICEKQTSEEALDDMTKKTSRATPRTEEYAIQFTAK